MFIQTEKLPDECEMRFLPGREVFPLGPISLDHESDLKKFPLASRLLTIDHVIGVILEKESIVIKRSNDINWLQLKPAVLGAVMDHFVADRPVAVEDIKLVDIISIEAMEYLVSLGVQHLLVDTPSVDRLFDDGHLSAHNIFWEAKGKEFNHNANDMKLQ